MTKRNLCVLLAALSVVVVACSRDKDKRDTAAPPLDSYEVTVTAVEVVNRDSGEPLEVTGLPAEGGTLTVQ